MYVRAPQPFWLEYEWLNSQAFRWRERRGWYYGFIADELVRVRQQADNGIEFEFESNSPADALKAEVERYFRLDQDISPVHEALRKLDCHMARLVGEYGHVRILRQDPWECLVAFICSRAASIAAIRARMERLAHCFGEPRTLGEVTHKAFPSAQTLVAARDDVLKMKLGLPQTPAVLLKVAGDVASGHLDLDELSRLPHENARKALTKYDNIGSKIADCVCLFSLGKDEAFPVDRHIAAALEERYGKTHTAGAPNVKLLACARDYFGANAGYAGQLLFLGQH